MREWNIKGYEFQGGIGAACDGPVPEVNEVVPVVEKKYLDEAKEELDKLSRALLKFGGKGAGMIWGLANCMCCGGLDNDYYFVGHNVVCVECFDSGLESMVSRLNNLHARSAVLLKQLNEAASLLREFADGAVWIKEEDRKHFESEADYRDRILKFLSELK